MMNDDNENVDGSDVGNADGKIGVCGDDPTHYWTTYSANLTGVSRDQTGRPCQGILTKFMHHLGMPG